MSCRDDGEPNGGHQATTFQRIKEHAKEFIEASPEDHKKWLKSTFSKVSFGGVDCTSKRCVENLSSKRFISFFLTDRPTNLCRFCSFWGNFLWTLLHPSSQKRVTTVCYGFMSLKRLHLMNLSSHYHRPNNILQKVSFVQPNFMIFLAESFSTTYLWRQMA